MDHATLSERGPVARASWSGAESRQCGHSRDWDAGIQSRHDPDPNGNSPGPYIVHPENCSSAVASRSAQPGSIFVESTFATLLRGLRATGPVPSALSVMPRGYAPAADEAL